MGAAIARALPKAELKRRHVGYRDLAEKLEPLGVKETERNIANKIARGGFTAVFFVQCLVTRASLAAMRRVAVGTRTAHSALSHRLCGWWRARRASDVYITTSSFRDSADGPEHPFWWPLLHKHRLHQVALDRDCAAHGRAVHQPPSWQIVILDRPVLHRAIVPHQQVPGAPLVAIDESRFDNLIRE